MATSAGSSSAADDAARRRAKILGADDGLTMSESFVEVEIGRDRLLVRRELREDLCQLLPAFLDGRALPGALALAGGRGQTLSVPLADGGRAVLRRNLRGGLPARIARDLYVRTATLRPFAEVRATERLRREGLEVPEPLAGIVRAAGLGLYRGAVATREIPAATNLWERLAAMPSAPARRELCAAAMGLVDRLLAIGGVHPDLNLKNFLVGADGAQLWLIDCDGVRFTHTGAEHRRRALARLRRSARRLDPQGNVVDPTWFEVARRLVPSGERR